MALVATAPSPAPWVRDAQVVVRADPRNANCRTGVAGTTRTPTSFAGAGRSGSPTGPPARRSSGRTPLCGSTGRATTAGASASRRSSPPPRGRDIRDPSFFTVRGRLFVKAITRLPGFALRDAGDASVSVQTSSGDGRRWTPLVPIGPVGRGFWRIVRLRGTLYSAAYEDGDRRVVLFRSRDGRWRRGPLVHGRAADTPLETELVPTAGGRRLLGLVRMDGTDFELLGERGRLRTKVGWSRAPFHGFSCRQELRDVRLDGAVAFRWRSRLFVIARKHLLGPRRRKRTALYELRGNLDRGPLTIREHGELPSAGDTSYAGVVGLSGSRFLVTWYSSPPALDPDWLEGFIGRTDIWRATLDLSRLGRGRTPRR